MKKTLILGTILGIFLTGCQVPDQLANFKLPDLSAPSATSSSTTKNSINDEYDGNKALANLNVNNMNRAKCAELKKIYKKFENKFCEVWYAKQDAYNYSRSANSTYEGKVKATNLIMMDTDKLKLDNYQKYRDLKEVCKNKVGYDFYDIYYCPERAKY
ncbi:hypothetical protein CUREO4125_01250 [Campylobacter ureolyticus]|uniref:hypothetical protein n=1 Tax=Campylobacter ureolyticus TaxID=827 RepID=UPI00215B2FB3|nr:hypothetical protein [Campylobacter ureolyticus]MCR8699014.1 hypothetical protein [Campylobacter ureolyticus]